MSTRLCRTVCHTSLVQRLFLVYDVYTFLYIHFLPHFYKPLSQMINILFFIENNGCRPHISFPKSISLWPFFYPTYSVYPPDTIHPSSSMALNNDCTSVTPKCIDFSPKRPIHIFSSPGTAALGCPYPLHICPGQHGLLIFLLHWNCFSPRLSHLRKFHIFFWAQTQKSCPRFLQTPHSIYKQFCQRCLQNILSLSTSHHLCC